MACPSHVIFVSHVRILGSDTRHHQAEVVSFVTSRELKRRWFMKQNLLCMSIIDLPNHVQWRNGAMRELGVPLITFVYVGVVISAMCAKQINEMSYTLSSIILLAGLCRNCNTSHAGKVDLWNELCGSKQCLPCLQNEWIKEQCTP